MFPNALSMMDFFSVAVGNQTACARVVTRGICSYFTVLFSSFFKGATL